MPEVNVSIGGRDFAVACQDGEEHFLRSAARMLDIEASVLVDQAGRMPETRMLLMAGLMLADKTAGMEEELRQVKLRLSDALEEAEQLRNTPPPAAEQIEVPVVPARLLDTLADFAARSEAIAQRIEDRTR